MVIWNILGADILTLAVLDKSICGLGYRSEEGEGGEGQRRKLEEGFTFLQEIRPGFFALRSDFVGFLFPLYRSNGANKGF